MIADSEGRAIIERLLIVRLSAMGDVIHALPAVQALREALPHAMIGWLIEDRWAELLCAPGAPPRGPRSPLRPVVDWVHPVKLTAWRKALFTIPTLQQVAKAWHDVRGTHYEVAVDLQGAIRSAVLTHCSSAGVVYGVAEPRESPASLWYMRQVMARGAHVIEQNLSVAAVVAGSKVNPSPVAFPHDPSAEERIGRDLVRNRIREYAIVNPGAG